MRHMLNTLFITTEDAYLTRDGENVVVKIGDAEAARFPLHALEGITSFSYAGASPALMGACVKQGINLSFCSPSGRFLARACGQANGNVLLRRTQYRVADDIFAGFRIAQNMVLGKIYNARWSVNRTVRDHPMRVDIEKMGKVESILADSVLRVRQAESEDELRGIEGAAASAYFEVFNDMILTDSEAFRFSGRNRRPPLDNVNAMLSFVYALLANDCAGALESAGLDSYVGFMHTDRPGRVSLALDIMEELRPCFADRLVLTLINNRVVSSDDFIKRESGAVIMTDDGRKKIIKAWQERKREEIVHPYLKEKMPWGLVPYVQSLLLARHLRGDIDGYPPFLWK